MGRSHLVPSCVQQWGPFGMFVRWLLYEQLKRGVKAARGYLEAHRDMLAHISGDVTSGECHPFLLSPWAGLAYCYIACL